MHQSKTKKQKKPGDSVGNIIVFIQSLNEIIFHKSIACEYEVQVNKP